MNSENVLQRENRINKSLSARRKRRVLLAVKYAISVLLCLFFIFPYLYMLNKSLMTYQQVASGATFWTNSLEFKNFAIVKTTKLA